MPPGRLLFRNARPVRLRVRARAGGRRHRGPGSAGALRGCSRGRRIRRGVGPRRRDSGGGRVRTRRLPGQGRAQSPPSVGCRASGIAQRC